MFLVGCIWIGIQQEFPDTPVNLTLRGSRLEQAVPLLEKKLKLKLSVDPALKENVVAIRVTALPTSRLMASLAKANVAVWTWKTDRFVLERPAELATKLDVQDRAKQLENVLSWQKEFAAKLGVTFWSDQQSDQFVNAVTKTNHPDNRMGLSLDGPRLNGPISGLVRWLAGHSDLRRLPSLGSRETFILSSTAESGPRAFDEKCKQEIAKVPKVYDKFLQIAEARLSDTERKSAFYQDVLDFASQTRGRLDYQLTITDFLTSFNVSGIVFDGDGRQLTWSFVPFNECPSRMCGEPAPDFIKNTAGEVPLSESSAWFQSLLPRSIGSSDIAPSPAVAGGFKEQDRARWSDVETHDPLSYTATDLVFALAGHRDVVAVLPDLMLAAAHRSVSNGKINLASFWAQQKARAPITFLEEKDCVIVKPSLTTLAERLTTDRRALAAVLRSINRAGYVPLPSWARYSAQIRSYSNYRWAEYVLMAPYLTSGYETPHPLQIHETSAAEYIGTLGNNVIDQLDQGREFSTTLFDERQRALLRHLGTYQWDESVSRAKDNVPKRVNITVAPTRVGSITMDFQDGGRISQDLDLSTERGQAEMKGKIRGVKTTKMVAESRRFRISIAWSHAPDVVLDVVEFGLKKPFESGSDSSDVLKVHLSHSGKRG